MIATYITEHAKQRPHHIALQGMSYALTYRNLNDAIVKTTEHLAKYPAQTRIAMAMNNQPAWVVLDIAALQLGLVQVPLPSFFSDAQLLHAMQDAGINVLITDQTVRFDSLLKTHTAEKSGVMIANTALAEYRLDFAQATLPEHTAKITYTSGTTGAPKGVCLSEKAMLEVAQAIATQVQLTPQDRHACILPLSTLLENVAGVYSSLIAGAIIHIYPSETVGFVGSSFDVKKLFATLALSQASTVILIPELLNALIKLCESEAALSYATALSHIRFVAVGGAHVSASLLQRASTIGLPVFEGYGLSESASVVTLNTPSSQKLGSVGRPLPHISMRLADDNEIWIKGANFISYTHEAANFSDDGWMATGDIGYCDAGGFWFIQGRKKNMFITSFGRNVSPEWVERELTHLPSIQQACVFGEARPWNVAIITAHPEADAAAVNASIAAVNAQLPDYARVSHWLSSQAAFSVNNGQLTPNGRLKRDAIWQTYQHDIQALYVEKE
jgi:long-chain acyl-CoA synthetase